MAESHSRRNQFMFDYLRKRLRIPAEKSDGAMRHSGNTVSATIPIAYQHAIEDGGLRRAYRVMLIGFGVAYSWGGALVLWQ